MKVIVLGKTYDLSQPTGRNTFLQKVRLLKAQKKALELEKIAAWANRLSTITNAERDFWRKIIKYIPSIDNPLITSDDIYIVPIDEQNGDITLYPRSEYYTRFEGSTAFVMANPDYWGTYHRSESTRFFDTVGGRKNTQFLSSDFLIKPTKINSFFAHTGGISNPFQNEKYQESIKQDRIAPSGEINVRDCSLSYKRKMAELIIDYFEKVSNNKVRLLKERCSKTSLIRPILNYENNYPYLLVSSPTFSPAEFDNEAAHYWSKNPKPIQRLLLASFIALVNVEAIKSGIPIEIVIRASFGHNLPSVCETVNTFRINIGIIPQQYAMLIAKSLVQLDEMFKAMSDASVTTKPFDDALLKKVRNYNIKKLLKAIDEKPRYQELIGSPGYLKATNIVAGSDENFDELFPEMRKLNKRKPARGRANVVSVKFKKDMNVWQAIRQRGNSKGNPLLYELFRENEAVDWFSNILMELLLANDPKPMEAALLKLIKCVQYNDKVTMNYTQIEDDLKMAKRHFETLSFVNIFKNDPAFDEITRVLFAAFCANRPNQKLYAALEHAGANFFTAYRGSTVMTSVPDYGSDSDCSDDFADNEATDKRTKKLTKKIHFVHKKLRVCSGMKAIVLAYYGALSHLKEKGVTSYQYDINQMYYEVGNALTMVKKLDLRELDQLKQDVNDVILFFDLNHCNASNSEGNQPLDKKLASSNPRIVILDYTSSTHDEVYLAAKQCFLRCKVDLVIMVDSGLKNCQGGQDFNPYGEVRVMTRNRKACQALIDQMTSVLSEQDKLPQISHEMVRAAKRRGLAFSLCEFVKSESGPYSSVESNDLTQLKIK